MSNGKGVGQSARKVMKQEEKLVEKYGRKLPYNVPEGYFDSLADNIMAKLPEYPAKPEAKEMTVWQRLKPYVYLAAMFAGIWCMMQVFHHAGGIGQLNLDNPPEQIAAYIESAPDEEILMIPDSESDSELIDAVSQQYDNMADFERDFGYKLKPQYAGMIVD